jgi:hypothetical protein
MYLYRSLLRGLQPRESLRPDTLAETFPSGKWYIGVGMFESERPESVRLGVES